MRSATYSTPGEKSTTSNVRVVHVVVAGNIGGAERMLVDLAARPELSGADHAIALFSPNPDVAALLRNRGLRVHDRGRVKEGPIRYLRQTFGRRDVRFVEDVLERERAEIVHLHTFASHVVGTRGAMATGARILRTDHSDRAYRDLSCVPFSLWSLRHADGVVGVSDHLRRLSEQRAPFFHGPRRVVLNGVDLSRFTTAPIPARGDGDGTAFTFAMVGRLEPRKGVEVALAALAKVPKARLAIVGDGPDRKKLEARARSLGVEVRTTFHGFHDDVQGLVKRAHAGISSSREEGLGLALLEIMATGRPVVAVPVGGIPEIVRNGSTGLLARDIDAEALAVAMRAMMGLPDVALAHLGAGARSFVEESASVEAMCRGYRDAYREIISLPPRLLPRSAPRPSPNAARA